MAQLSGAQVAAGVKNLPYRPVLRPIDMQPYGALSGLQGAFGSCRPGAGRVGYRATTSMMHEAFWGPSRIGTGLNRPNGKHGWAWAVRTAVAVGGGSSPLLRLALSAAVRHGPSTRCAAPHQWTSRAEPLGLALFGGPPEPASAT